MNRYLVTVTAKHPAAGEHPGTFEFDARNSADAVKQARREMWNRGHTRQDGPLIFKVTKWFND
jgi:hypothetical protein